MNGQTVKQTGVATTKAGCRRKIGPMGKQTGRQMAENNNSIITTKKLSKTFSSGGFQQHVLRNLDIDIYTGDFTVIMGPSGSGKSTLLYLLSGIDSLTLGEIVFDGEVMSDKSDDGRALFRRNNCGFVFQRIYLCDDMSLMDNAMLSGLLMNKNRKQVTERAKRLFKEVGLSPHDWNKFPAQLSGGEAQKGALVRAMINTPKMLFADEPTGSLDSLSSKMVLDLLTHANRSGQSIVLVTHDVVTALRGNRILYLSDGAIKGECDLGFYQGVIGDEKARGMTGHYNLIKENEHEAARTERLNLFLSEMR